MKANQQILDFVNHSKEELVQLRRWFHQHPESAYVEIQTSSFIVQYLETLGIHNISIEAKTGVVCEIGSGDKVGACRFNMDALPIQEMVDSSFKSIFEGFSHSCGHDFELAWGLLIAKYFTTYPPQNTLRLVFQPAEEGPGDDALSRTGGQLLAEQGIFNVDAIFSLHVDPEVPLGTVSIIEGDVTCAAYDFEYTLQGKVCHAAKPHLGINPVPYASKVISDLYLLEENLKARLHSSEGFVVITPTAIDTHINNSGIVSESLNTIPEYVIIKGISRVRSIKPIEMLLDGFEAIKRNYPDLVSLQLKLKKRAPATSNSNKLVKIVIESCNENDIQMIMKPTNWRDDAGWASEKAPTAHGFLGIGGNVDSRLHSPQFNPDEKGLEVGLIVFLNSLGKFLNS